MLVSIVIPCYNSEQSIREVVELTMEQFEKMPEYTCEFILVNDCSSDNTFGQIRALCDDYKNVHGINLMRNFGQHNALMCAMNYAEGDYVLGMDDDMQTHPSQIPLLLGKISEGYDIVYGTYEKLKNSPLKNLSSWFNTVTSRALLGRPKGVETSNYWVITKRVCEEVIKYTGYNPYLDGVFFRTSLNVGNVRIKHHTRAHGRSGYTFRKLVLLWVSYFNYSIVPLRIATILGALVAVIGIVAGIVTVIRKVIDPSIAVGWASTVTILLVFFGIVLLVLGIIGEYIGKLMLTVNNTPQFIIREKINLNDRERK